MRIIFFNAFHNGDVHLSRGFVRAIMRYVRDKIDPNIRFGYAHRNDHGLLKDIPGLELNCPWGNHNEHDNLVHNGDDVYINTWYGQQHHKYMNRYGISFDTLYSAIDDSCKSLWQVSLSDISSSPRTFFPIIDYDAFEISKAKDWLNKHQGRKVLVENAQALSGQAINFDMSEVIGRVAQNHPEITFIMTAPSSSLASNIVQSRDIIGKNGTDLNETSYLSSACEMVIGRASGVFSFCITQENLFGRPLKMPCFSNLVPIVDGKFWLGDMFQNRVSYQAKIMTTNQSDLQMVQEIIEQRISG